MNKGETYECKIKLFGQVVKDKTKNCVGCVIINENITIGQKELVEVSVDNDIYYVFKCKLGDDFKSRASPLPLKTFAIQKCVVEFFF